VSWHSWHVTRMAITITFTDGDMNEPNPVIPPLFIQSTLACTIYGWLVELGVKGKGKGQGGLKHCSL
jgi:hypothetical protein